MKSVATRNQIFVLELCLTCGSSNFLFPELWAVCNNFFHCCMHQFIKFIKSWLPAFEAGVMLPQDLAFICVLPIREINIWPLSACATKKLFVTIFPYKSELSDSYCDEIVQQICRCPRMLIRYGQTMVKSPFGIKYIDQLASRDTRMLGRCLALVSTCIWASADKYFERIFPKLDGRTSFWLNGKCFRKIRVNFSWKSLLLFRKIWFYFFFWEF